MQIRDFAEQLFSARSLEEKLFFPNQLVDNDPFLKGKLPSEPLRPDCLALKRRHKTPPPTLAELEDPHKRGLLLHYFANHELLAIELMAYALLKFPDAPVHFRRSILATIKDEQRHLQLYLNRIKDYGVEVGDVPLNTFFWDLLKGIENPKQYMCGMALTLEQANLDFALQFRQAFQTLGDADSADLLSEVYEDEITHVRLGVNYMQRHRQEGESDWQAFVNNLPPTLSPIRAKAPVFFDEEGRRKAGMSEDFIREIRTFTASRGRDPKLFIFNPNAEASIANNNFSPNRKELAVVHDLAPLLIFWARKDDILLVPQMPSKEHLLYLTRCGLSLPQMCQVEERIIKKGFFKKQRIKEISPWAWSADVYKSAVHFDNKPTAHDHLFDKTNDLIIAQELAEGLPTSVPIEEQTAGKVATTFAECLELIGHFRSLGFSEILFKSPLASSGQGTLRLLEDELEENQSNWLKRRIRLQGKLIIEPLLARVFDFSAIGKVDNEGVRFKGFTAMENDLRGQYCGSFAGNFDTCIPQELKRFFGEYQLKRVYEKLVIDCGKILAKDNYIGVFGIDAFVYRKADGDFGLKLLCEINPRMTMGALALEVSARCKPGTCVYLSLLLATEDMREKVINLSAQESLTCELDHLQRPYNGFIFPTDPRFVQQHFPIITMGKNPRECRESLEKLSKRTS